MLDGSTYLELKLSCLSQLNLFFRIRMQQPLFVTSAATYVEADGAPSC